MALSNQNAASYDAFEWSIHTEVNHRFSFVLYSREVNLFPMG